MSDPAKPKSEAFLDEVKDELEKLAAKVKAFLEGDDKDSDVHDAALSSIHGHLQTAVSVAPAPTTPPGLNEPDKVS